jgi:hypothetical protein
LGGTCSFSAVAFSAVAFSAVGAFGFSTLDGSGFGATGSTR